MSTFRIIIIYVGRWEIYNMYTGIPPIILNYNILLVCRIFKCTFSEREIKNKYIYISYLMANHGNYISNIRLILI